jgi:hypothetical protein
VNKIEANHFQNTKSTMTPTAGSSKRKTNHMDNHLPAGPYLLRSEGRLKRMTPARWRGPETSNQKKKKAKKAAKKTEPATRRGEIASVDEQGQVYWEIDRILDERVAASGDGNGTGMKEYLVRWKGSKDPHSWLPESHLNASALTDRDALKDALVGLASVLTNYVGETITEESIFNLKSSKLYDLRDELAAYIPCLQGKEGEQEQDENKQMPITKRLPPTNKDALTKATECPSCQTTAFAADPVNNDQDEAPIQSRACSHSICRGCVGGLHMVALEESLNSSRKWLNCPICKKENAFHAVDRHINHLACQILQACHTTTTTITKLLATNTAASVPAEDTKLPARDSSLRKVLATNTAAFVPAEDTKLPARDNPLRTVAHRHGQAYFFDVQGPAVEQQKEGITIFDVEGPAATTVDVATVAEHGEETCKVTPQPVIDLEDQALEEADQQDDTESLDDDSDYVDDEEERDTVLPTADHHERVKLPPPPPRWVIDLDTDTEEMDLEEGFATVDEQQDETSGATAKVLPPPPYVIDVDVNGASSSSSSSVTDQEEDIKDMGVEEATMTALEHQDEDTQMPTVVTPSPLSLEENRLDEDDSMKKKRRRASRNLSILISNDVDHQKESSPSPSSLSSSADHQDAITPAPCVSTRIKTEYQMDHDRQQDQVTCIDLCNDDSD